MIATFTLPTPQSSFKRSRRPPRPGVRWHGWPAVLRCNIQVSVDIVRHVCSCFGALPVLWALGTEHHAGLFKDFDVQRCRVSTAGRWKWRGWRTCEWRLRGRDDGGGGPVPAVRDAGAGGAGLRRGSAWRRRRLLGQRLRLERRLGGMRLAVAEHLIRNCSFGTAAALSRSCLAHPAVRRGARELVLP